LLLGKFCQSNKVLCQAAEKTLKQHTWVSSPLQVRPPFMFNGGIRDQFSRFLAVPRYPAGDSHKIARYVLDSRDSFNHALDFVFRNRLR